VVPIPNPDWVTEAYAFVAGTNSSNNCTTHLYVAHFKGGNWQWEYPPDLPGTTLNSYPAAVGYYPSDVYGGDVYVIGSNGQLYDLHWTQGQYQWGSWMDLGMPQIMDPVTHQMKSITLQGNPAAIYDPTGIYVAARGTDGHLYVWASSTGQFLDAGTPPYSTIASDPTEVVYPPDINSDNRDLYVFVTGANGNVYGVKWYGLDWEWFYYRPHTTTAVGRPFTYLTPVNGVAYFDVFVRGADGHMEDLVWDGHYWGFVDMTTAAPGLSPGYTIGCGAGGAGTDIATYAFYACGTDGSLANLIWNGAGWSWQDLARPTTGMPIISDAGVIGVRELIGNYIVSTTSAFVTGGDGRMYIAHWEGTPWVNLGTP
jgi:hypothetical protein